MSARRPVRPRLGLGARLGLALVATSLATLLAATVALVPPLEGRLEHQRILDLRGLSRTARPALRSLTAADAAPGSARLDAVVHNLARRAGGRIEVLDAEGRLLARSSLGRAGTAVSVPERTREAALARGGGVSSDVRDDDAVVVSSIRSRGGPRLTLVIAKDLDDTRAAATAVRRTLPIAALCGLAVGVLLAALLSRGLLARLRGLRTDARALSEQGLNHAVTVGGADEVAEVAAALELMRRRLVDEESARQAFLASASHELRTPLSSLLGTLELLVERADDPRADPEVRARARVALRQALRLVDLSTDLLDLNRLDGAPPPVVEPLDLAAVVASVAAEASGPLAAEGLELRVALAPGPLVALADAAAVARILLAVLDNARKYGAGPVWIGSEAVEGVAEIHVDDAGPGVDEAERERIFLRFERGVAVDEHPGFGLGLPIARGLARAIGGDLAVRRSPGGGARFVLSLALCAAVADAAPTTPEDLVQRA